MKSVILIDGKNFACRQYATHMELRNSQGQPTGLLHGALTGMLGLAKRIPGAPVVWVWDGPGKTWRHRLVATYKANRGDGKGKSDFDGMYVQLPLLQEFLTRLGFCQWQLSGVEADDLIGVLSTEFAKKNYKVYICSTDRDFYQLISTTVSVGKGLDNGKLHRITEEEILTRFGVPLRWWTEYRALVGDAGDNILPAYKGIGPVTARQMTLDGLHASVPTFGTLRLDVQNKYRVWKKGKQTWPFEADWLRIRDNYALVTIVTDVEKLGPKTAAAYDELTWNKKLHRPELEEGDWQYMTRFFAKYELRDLMARRKEMWDLP